MISAYYIKGVRTFAVYFFTIFNRIIVTPGWKVGRSVRFRGPIHRYSSHGNVSIGDNCLFGPFVVISTEKNASILIGNDVSLNQGTHVIASAKISIGDGSRIGEYVCIRDSNHAPLHKSSPGSMISSEVFIGNNVWIGAHAVILKGVRIGSNSVVAAGAVVTKDVAEFATVAGVPAKQISTRQT